MYSLVRPLLFRLDPEKAHGLALKGLSLLPAGKTAVATPRLETRIAGLSFPNPVGLAAGFDKDGMVWRQMLGAGFGSVEVGTLTPRPQSGNPKPRMFRLASDRAVINRLGFNNGGIEAALPRLEAHPLLGVNVGANKDSADRIADYAFGVRAVRDRAAWITLNISSPNTPGLRGLQGEALPELLAAAVEARGSDGPPLFLKVAPDLNGEQIEAIAKTAVSPGISALIVSNTTLARPASLQSSNAGETGGLSGAPLMVPSTQVLAHFAKILSGELPLVGVGGISSAEDAYAKIRAGATMVQLYSGMVYEGLGIARKISSGLEKLLERDGFSSVSEAIGADL